MNDNPALTPVQAEAITQLGADLMSVMVKRITAADLDWTHAVAAAAIACRGVAAREMAVDSDLDLDKARQVMFLQFLNVLSMPAELVRAFKTDDGEDFEAVVLPVVRQ